MTWNEVHKERVAERRAWIYSTVMLLKELGRLRDERRISESEYLTITMRANPDCSWGYMPPEQEPTAGGPPRSAGHEGR